MRIASWLAVAGTTLLVAGCMTEEPPHASHPAGDRLSAALEGYVRDGPAVRCVRSQNLAGNRTVTDDSILFTGSGGRAWVNRTRGSCPDLDFGRALRFSTVSAQLCQGDIANVFDPTSGVEYGGCALGEFIPYRRSR